MSDSTKIFSLPSETSGSGLLNVIAPLLQQRGLDPNMVFAMMNNRDGGFGGEGGWFVWLIFLFILFGWGGNGWGGNGANGGLSNQLNNDYGRQLLLDAINRNGTDISALASSVNCSTSQVQNAICQVQSLIQGVGNQVGMSSLEVINAIQSGNASIASQMAECCCNIRESITRQGYENQLATVSQTNTLQGEINTVNSSVERGFASNEYNQQAQTNAIVKAIADQTNFINTQFCNLEMREMQNKIDSLRLENQSLKFAESQAAQNNYLISQLQPVAKPAYITCSPYQAAWGFNPYNYNNGNNCGCNCGCGV